jgi:AraC-like DNA-binding protein
MLPNVFTTKRMPLNAQFEWWHRWNLPLLEFTANDEFGEGFAAALRAWCMGDGLLLTELEAPAATAVRSRRLLRHTPEDHWVITYVSGGTMTIETPGGSTAVGQGRTHVWSLGEPSVITHADISRLDIYLSRDTFRDIAPVLDAVIGLPLDGKLEQALGEFLIALKQRLPRIPAPNAAKLVDAIRMLVAGTLAPAARQRPPAKGTIDVGRLEQVRQAVRANLQSRELGTQMLCRAVGMSRSSLYRLLESAGGVASYIQRHRLDEARHRLADSANAQPIEAMARELCFADASTFSRAFRAEYAMSPSEARAGASDAVIVARARAAPELAGAAHFVDLLRL